MITWLRNWLYDNGFKRSESYPVPIICVGNLSTGGTGKSPMIEYLIRLLQDDYLVATLSRGYKRVTSGFILADSDDNVDTIGDEPYQFYRKFSTIQVAVDEQRQNGITQLLDLPQKPDVILLDDAFQHRKVRAGFNILLTAYNELYCDDMVLPTGNLREPRSGSRRANLIVVTKCKEDISAAEKLTIAKKLKIRPQQQLFFSFISYGTHVVSKHKRLELYKLPKFTLVTGIANANPLVEFLSQNSLQFDHIEYGDHYNFRITDIELLETKSLIVTTEKDFVRLSDNEELEHKLFYLPIEMKVDEPEKFNTCVASFLVEKT